MPGLQCSVNTHYISVLPEPGLEPGSPKAGDFKSPAYTNSATPAGFSLAMRGGWCEGRPDRAAGVEGAFPTLHLVAVSICHPNILRLYLPAMHWPSFLAGLLVLPVFVLFAGLAQSVLQSMRRRRTSFVGNRSTTPLARGAEPLEFTSRLMGRIGSSDSPRRAGGSGGSRGPGGSARAS